jgi:CheY-like chemotaxis protein
MGGTLSLASQPGDGASFTISLPLARVGDSSKAVDQAEPEPERSPLSLKILAAEDNLVNQQVLKTILEQVGLAVTLVGDGEQAVAAHQSQTWDLILMDVQMPVMDGPAATRAIRDFERGAGRPRTPIVALTANVMEHQKAEYLACGMDYVVAKPLQIPELFAAIDAMTAGPTATRAALSAA